MLGWIGGGAQVILKNEVRGDCSKINPLISRYKYTTPLIFAYFFVTHSVTYSVTHSVTYSVTHSVTYCVTHSVTHMSIFGPLFFLKLIYVIGGTVT